MHIRFGTDGVRGEANSALTVETALALGRAAARVFPTSRVVIGRDTRRSGPMLELAVAAGVCAEGADAVLLGVVPTPAVAAVSAQEKITGVMISASHNPFYDNGIKLFAPGGRKLSDAEQAQVEAALEDLLQPVPHPGPVRELVGRVIQGDAQAGEAYLDSVAAAIEGRTLQGLKVVLDCANGSNFEFGPLLLERLGVELCVLANSPDGLNINHECGSTSIAALSERVVEQSGHIIFADHSTTGDGLLGAVVLLDLLRRSGRPLAELAQAAMTRLPQVLLNVPVSRPMPEIASLLNQELSAATAELGETGRVLLRPSGTEAVVRVMVEAEQSEDAQRIAEQLALAVEMLARS